MYVIGQKVPYLYKVNKEEFTIEAEIISLNGNTIEIEFTAPATTQMPGGFLMRRSLRTAKERARLLNYTVPRPGAPIGNQNAAKDRPRRVLVTISFSGDRLERAAQFLQSDVDRKMLKELTFKAVDTYLKSPHQ